MLPQKSFVPDHLPLLRPKCLSGKKNVAENCIWEDTDINFKLIGFCAAVWTRSCFMGFIQMPSKQRCFTLSHFIWTLILQCLIYRIPCLTNAYQQEVMSSTISPESYNTCNQVIVALLKSMIKKSHISEGKNGCLELIYKYLEQW